MGYVKVYVHLVWATYKRQPLLTNDIRKEVFTHMRKNAFNKGIFLDHIGGYTNHIHCLISLKGDQSISKICQLLKGESTYWINKTKITKVKFRWQEEYYAVSIGESQKNIVRNYIRNQEIHHQKVSYEEEYKQFLKLYGFSKFLG